MSSKKQKPPRRVPISIAPVNTVEDFVKGGGSVFLRQEEISNSARQAQEEKRWKKNKILADRRRVRLILDLSRDPQYSLEERTEKVCDKWGVPSSHFVALCLKFGLEAVEDGRLNLDDYIETYDGRN